ALRELTIEGIETSRDFHLRVMEDEEFRRGDISIQWLERKLPEIIGAPPDDDALRVAAIAAALVAERDRGTRRTASSNVPDRSSDADAWRRAAWREGLRSS